MRNANRYTQKQRSLGGLNKPRRAERFEEVLARFHDDRKGLVIAEGCTNGIFWQLRHSTKHARQFDVLHDGKLIARGNARSLPGKWIRAKARKAAKENTTYKAIRHNGYYAPNAIN